MRTGWASSRSIQENNGRKDSTPAVAVDGAGGQGAREPPPAKHSRPTFLDWTRRVSGATLHRLKGLHGACDETTGSLEGEIKRFKEIEDHYEDVQSQVDQYTSSLTALIRSDGWLTTVLTEGPGGPGMDLPEPESTPTTGVQLLSYNPILRKQTGGDLIHATLLLSFEEFFNQPLRDAARHLEDLRRHIKRRQILVADYEHHKRKLDAAGSDHKPSPDYERAAGLVKEASTWLKLHLNAFDEGYSQLQQSISQGHTACQMFYHRAQLSRIEGSPLDHGLRQMLEVTVEVLHPEVGRYLSWMKSVAFVLGQNLNPKELGGCVTPFEVLLATMVEALKPKPGLFFGRPLARHGEDVPAIIIACTRYLDQNGMYTEGLFRVPGNIETVNILKARFDKGQALDFMDEEAQEDEEQEGAEEGTTREGSAVTVHDVATLFKMYFRELPSPLLPPSCLRQLLGARSLPAPEFVVAVRETVASSSFPPAHAKTLRLMLAFLYRVNLCAEFNKMTSKNLGVCLAPSVLRASDTEELALSDIQPGIALVQKLIENAPDVFDDLWEDYPAVEEVGEEVGEQQSPPRRQGDEQQQVDKEEEEEEEEEEDRQGVSYLGHEEIGRQPEEGIP